MNILIADSGSTKTDWRFIGENREIFSFRSEGYNPYMISGMQLQESLQREVVVQMKNKKADHLFFYGAGCGTEEKTAEVKKQLMEIFPNAAVEVMDDLLGAARALCGNEKGMAAILGTGSNSCCYDGKNISEKRPSLGFILGDEGSGAALGKELIRKFLYDELDVQLRENFIRRFVVAVWVGNASGEGRPGLVGVQTAAPILFDIFNTLHSPDWFKKPESDMQQVSVCKESGCRANELCDAELQWIPKSGMKSEACPYHQLIHLDPTGQFRVTSDCEDVSKMQHVAWFILPPAEEYYYKQKNPNYKSLPPFRSDCGGTISHSMEFVYPRTETQLFIPTELDGRPGKVIFEVAHRRKGTIVYWHLDDQYMGMTTDIHQFAMNPEPGKHTVTVVDEFGETESMKFEIVNERKK